VTLPALCVACVTIGDEDGITVMSTSPEPGRVSAARPPATTGLHAPVLKAAVKSAKVKSHGNNACEVHVISGDAQTDQQMWKRKAILDQVLRASHTASWV